MAHVPIMRELEEQAIADGIHQLVVGAVIEHEQKVLILRRPGDDFMGGIWELPSGKVEAGETLDAALVREVEEETGLTVTEIREYRGSFDYTSGSGKKSRQFNFNTQVSAVDPVVLQEHDSYTWAPLDAALPVTDAVKTLLQAE